MRLSDTLLGGIFRQRLCLPIRLRLVNRPLTGHHHRSGWLTEQSHSGLGVNSSLSPGNPSHPIPGTFNVYDNRRYFLLCCTVYRKVFNVHLAKYLEFIRK